MGNVNCNNAVPCMGNENLQGSPNSQNVPRQGLTSKVKGSVRRTEGTRSIENLLQEQQDQGKTMMMRQSTQQLLNYGLYLPMMDETGTPHHYIVDQGGNSSSNSDRSQRNLDVLYDSQRASLFEEFVNETTTNFSGSQFDKSISLIEFRIQSQIFTRKHIPEQRKKKRFGSSKSKKQETGLPDPQTEFSLSIGDVLMCKWSGEEDNWDTKTNDPNEFPYNPLLKPVAAEPEKKSKKKKGAAEPEKPSYPDVVSRRICLPFEFRYTNQEVQLEIRDSTDNCLLYEVQIPFEQLLGEPQLLQEPNIILASSDSRHLVRMSVRELEESQKVICSLNLQEPSTSDREISSDSMLLSTNEDKLDFWTASTEVFEVRQGERSRVRCIHQKCDAIDTDGDWQLPLKILMPHYEIGFFKERVFQIEFDQKKYLEINGEDLMKLSGSGTLTRNLINISTKSEQVEPRRTRLKRNVSELNSQDESSEGPLKSRSCLSFNKTDGSVDRMIQQATSGLEMTLDTIAASESILPEEGKRSESAQNMSTMSSQAIKICSPARIERPLSTVGLIQSGDLRVVPLIGIDFSLGNLTFENDNTLMHSTNPSKPNNYRSLLRMISHAYRNVLNLPIFGFGSKTSPFSTKTCHLFPLSRSIRNPFTPNDENTIEQVYQDCLSQLELSLPVNVTPMVNFMRKLGQHQEKRLRRKANQQQSIRGTFGSFYVLYVLSTGIIDDVKELVAELGSREWRRMPLQVHFISLSPNHLQEKDQDTQDLCTEVNKLNIEAGWPQFQIHFYDRIWRATKSDKGALLRLKQDSVLRVPRDIESCCFANGFDLSNYRHNQNLTNATQSQQYIMDIIDQKFEKLKESIYKLGISPQQFRNMVEGQALYEWSPEVAVALGTRFCSWVVAETAEEHNDTEESKSVLLGRRKSQFDQLLEIRSRNNSQKSVNQLQANTQNLEDQQQKKTTNASNEQDNEGGEPTNAPTQANDGWQSAAGITTTAAAVATEATPSYNINASSDQPAPYQEIAAQDETCPEQVAIVTEKSEDQKRAKSIEIEQEEGDNPEVIQAHQEDHS